MTPKFDKNYFETLYKKEKGFLWGTEPNRLTVRLTGIIPKGRILDLGCDEGKDALYLAKEGYKVDAVDISESAINKLTERASRERITLNAKVADLENYTIKKDYDAIVSLAAIHFIEHKNKLQELIENIKDRTKKGGLNIITVFRKGDPSEKKFKMYFFEDNELLRFYSDWKIIYYNEYLKKDKHNTEDKVHYHRNAEIIAQKIK